MESAWLFSAGTPRHWSGRPVWVFLDRACLLLKPSIPRVGFPWISLDSLVRIETYQRVTGIKRPEFFLGPLSVASAPPERKHAVEAMRKHRTVHGDSLTWFTIFQKKLSLGPVPWAL